LEPGQQFEQEHSGCVGGDLFKISEDYSTESYSINYINYINNEQRITVIGSKPIHKVPENSDEIQSNLCLTLLA